MTIENEVIEVADVEETGVALINDSVELTNVLKELPVNKFATSDALLNVMGSGFLPYIQLMGGNSDEVKRGEFTIGHFALRRGRELVDLGKEFVCMVLAVRPKAMQFKPDVITVYDTKSEDFQKFAGIALRDSNSGYAFGPEFLLWLPNQEEFALYFMGNKTGRNEAPNLIKVLEQKIYTCKQRSNLIDNGKHTWHGPITLSHDLPINMPPSDHLRKEVTKFNTPPAIEKSEEVEKSDGAVERR